MIYHTKVKKAGIVIPIDWDKLPEISQERAKAYGLVQLVGDSLSAFSLEGSKTTTKTTADELARMANEYVEALYRGEVKKTRVGAGDTVGKLAFGYALKRVCNIWLKKNPGKKLKEYENRNVDAQVEYTANQAKYDDMAQSEIELTSADE